MGSLAPSPRIFTLASVALRVQARAAPARRGLRPHAPRAIRQALGAASWRGFCAHPEPTPGVLLERAVRRLVREQLEADTGVPPKASVEANDGTRDLRKVIEGYVHEALGPISEELRARFVTLEQQKAQPQQGIDVLLQEALAPLREELEAKLTEDTTESLIQVRLDEALAPVLRELRAKVGADEAQASAQELICALAVTLRGELQAKPSGEEVQAAAKKRAEEAVAALRKEIQNWLPGGIDRAVKEAMKPLSEAIAEDVQRSAEHQIREAVGQFQEQLQGKLGADSAQELVRASVHRAIAPIREELQWQQPLEHAVQQAVETHVGQAVTSLRQELLHRQRPTEEALERLAEELRLQQPVEASLRPLAEACAREAVEPLREELQQQRQRQGPPVEPGVGQLVEAEVAQLRGELEALRRAQVAPESPPRSLLARSMRLTLQLLGGGVVLLVAVGIASEAPPRPQSIAKA